MPHEDNCELISRYLNEMGADGWELIPVVPSDEACFLNRLHFKRQLSR